MAVPLLLLPGLVLRVAQGATRDGLYGLGGPLAGEQLPGFTRHSF